MRCECACGVGLNSGRFGMNKSAVKEESDFEEKR
jgi:hypothetical protein